MYNKTAEELHGSMLAAMDNSYQKTVGYPTHDILKAVAIAMEPYGREIENAANKLDIYNLSGEELRRFVEQRSSVKFRDATHATALLTVAGNGTVPKGMLFESEGGIQFTADEETVIEGEGIISVTALVAGPAGNVGAGSITMIPKTVQGISSCVNTEPASGGYAAETDDTLRERYVEAKSCPPTSGNVHHYKMWAKEVPGVGDAKVYPLWAGDNTVQIVIINDQMQTADETLIEAVQEHIDPEGKGLGLGEAPVGAYCTVTSAEALTIDISVTLTVLDDYTVDIQPAIREYLQSIAFKENYVSYARIGDAIFDVPGVKDHADLLVNGEAVNISVPDKSVAVLGMVTVNE